MLLSMALEEHPPAQLEHAIELFAEDHNIEADALAASLKAHRFVLREAARAEVSVDAYVADLRAVAVEHDVEAADALVALMQPAFDPAMRKLHHEMVTGAVADHGKVMTGVKWRVDKMVGSDRGTAQEKRVGVLTFQYREGSKAERITLQALPDVLSELHRALQEMLEQ